MNISLCVINHCAYLEWRGVVNNDVKGILPCHDVDVLILLFKLRMPEVKVIKISHVHVIGFDMNVSFSTL